MGGSGVMGEDGVLMVSDKDDRVLTKRSVPNRIDHLRNVGLPPLDVSGRMFVILRRTPGEPKIRVNQCHLRKRAYSRSLRKEYCKRQVVGIGRTETAALRRILEVVGPGDTVPIEP